MEKVIEEVRRILKLNEPHLASVQYTFSREDINGVFLDKEGIDMSGTTKWDDQFLVGTEKKIRAHSSQRDLSDPDEVIRIYADKVEHFFLT
jgi:hypothetical protein